MVESFSSSIRGKLHGIVVVVVVRGENIITGEGKGVMFIVFQWDVINCVALMAPLNPKYGNHKLGNAARKIVDGRIDINIHALLLALDSRDLSTS